MKYYQLNMEQQDSALDQIVAIENSWITSDANVTREDVEFDISEGQNPDDFYTFEVIDDNNVIVEKRG